MSSTVPPYKSPYSTPADVDRILNTTTTTTTVPTTSQVQDIIVRGDSWIDEVTGHNWRTNNTTELYDAIGTGPRAGTIILRNKPVLSVDVVEYWDGGSKTWIAGIQGFPEEAPDKQTYYSYLPEGKVVWHKLRLDQRQRYRVRYTWGYQSTPDFIRDLSGSIAAREVVLFWGGQFGIQEDITLWKKRIDEKVNRLLWMAARRPVAAVG